MDRLDKTETGVRRPAGNAPEACRILKFPVRPARLPTVDYGSGWYHQAAIDDGAAPMPPKR